MYRSEQAWNRYYQALAETARMLVDPSTGLLDKGYAVPIPCPFCGGWQHTHRCTVIGFSYVTCSCGMVFINPQLTPDTLKRVYNDEHARRLFFEEVLLPFGEQDQVPVFQERLRSIRSVFGAPKGRLLDVGCAAGNFLRQATAAGFQSEGLELDDLYTSYVRSHRPELKVISARLEDMQYPSSTFQVVTLWDVLEHVPQPFQMLQEIHRILLPSGVLALTTINHACFNARVLGPRWRYYQPPDHVCSFTPALLRSMLEKAGFTVLKIRHHFMFEVLRDGLLPPRDNLVNQADRLPLVTKIKKGMFLIASSAMQTVMNHVHSGDLLTVVAQKR